MEWVLQHYKETLFEDVLFSYLSFSLFTISFALILIALSLYISKKKQAYIIVAVMLFIVILYQAYASIKSFYQVSLSESKNKCCPVKSFEYSKRLIFEKFEIACLDNSKLIDRRVSFENIGSQYNYLEYYDKRKSPLVCFTVKGDFLKIDRMQETD